MSIYLPPNLWAMHPLYLADVQLFCSNVPELEHDPAWATSSHFLYGAHPLRGVEFAGTVTLETQRSNGQQVFVLDDGSGESVQASIFKSNQGVVDLKRVRIGDAIVVSGVLGWAYPLQTSSNTQVRELRVQKLRIVRGGNGLNELCTWWLSTRRLHDSVYCKRLEELLPNYSPLLPELRSFGLSFPGETRRSASFVPVVGFEAIALPKAVTIAPTNGSLPCPAKAPQIELKRTRGGSLPHHSTKQMLSPALFSRLVLTLQHSLDLHHPLSRGSASAVSRDRFQVLKRARNLTSTRMHMNPQIDKGAGGDEGRGLGIGSEKALNSDSDESSSDSASNESQNDFDGDAFEEEIIDGRASLQSKIISQGLHGNPEQRVKNGAATIFPSSERDTATVSDDNISDAETIFDEDDPLAKRAAPHLLPANVFRPISKGLAAGSDFTENSVVLDDGRVSSREAVSNAMAQGKWVVYVSQDEEAMQPSVAPVSSAALSFEPPSLDIVFPINFALHDAIALLEATSSSFLNEIKRSTTLPLVLLVTDALQRLVSDGIVCFVGESGAAGRKGTASLSSTHHNPNQLYTIVSHVELLVPFTLSALRSGGALWDGMEMEGLPLTEKDPRHMTECDLHKVLKCNTSIKNIPINVLRSSWKLMEEDGLIVKPTPYTFSIPV